DTNQSPVTGVSAAWAGSRLAQSSRRPTTHHCPRPPSWRVLTHIVLSSVWFPSCFALWNYALGRHVSTMGKRHRCCIIVGAAGRQPALWPAEGEGRGLYARESSLSDHCPPL